MDKNVLFHEKQHFRQWWLWLILIVFPAYSIYSGWQQYLNSGSLAKILLVNGSELLILGIIIAFLLLIRLETIIREDRISVRLFPIHLKFKHFRWSELRKANVRRYSPLGEYGGWGLRWGIFGSGAAYNISGNKGLQLVFKSGKKLLIGTKKPKELDIIIQHKMDSESIA